jgi:hypothetical protein
MDWQTLANPIGHSNGDHDLARNVLEVPLIIDYLPKFVVFIFASFSWYFS